MRTIMITVSFSGFGRRYIEIKEIQWFLLICFYLFFWCFFEHFLQRIRRQKCSVFSAKMMALVITHTYMVIIYRYIWYESTLKHTSNFHLHATLIEQANKRLNKIGARCFHEKKLDHSRYFLKNADNNSYCFLFRVWNAIFAKNNWNWEIELVYIFWL